MSVNQGLATETWGLEAWSVLFQKLAEQEGLLAELNGVAIIGKEVLEFVAEHGEAAWLQRHQRHAGADKRPQRPDNFSQQALGPRQHSKVVKRPAAAQILLGHIHTKSRSFQDFNRRLRSIGEKVVVESVGPEDYGRAV